MTSVEVLGALDGYPLATGFEDEVTRWNMLYPLSSRKLNARYIGEIYRAMSTADVREAYEPHNIRFVYEGDSPNTFYCREHLTFTFLSDFTYNRVGYVDVDLDDLDPLGFGERFTLSPGEQAQIDAAADLQEQHGIAGLVPGLDHIGDSNPGRRARGRHPRVPDDGAVLLLGGLQHQRDELIDECHPPPLHRRRQEVTGASLHRQQHTVVRQLVRLPADADRGLRAQLRQTNAPHGAGGDRRTSPSRRTSTTSSELGEMGTPFLAHVVGECKDEPNLKQIFSKSSPYSMLITEYVERCHGYEGFFTRDNVAALTAAAGADERYEHGHVFD